MYRQVSIKDINQNIEDISYSVKKFVLAITSYHPQNLDLKLIMVIKAIVK